MIPAEQTDELIRRQVGKRPSRGLEKNPIARVWELYLLQKKLGIRSSEGDGEFIRKIVGPSS